MDKVYIKTVTSFLELEKALNDGFNVFKRNIDLNVFKRDMDLNNKKLESLSSLSKFSYSVLGNFDCSNNKLKSLEGCPKSVGGVFLCYDNNLETLKGSPETVGNNFSCANNQLMTLEGAPKYIGGGLACFNNKLTTLEGCPIIDKLSVTCHGNNFIPLEKKKKNIFKLGDNIYIDNTGALKEEDIQRLINTTINKDWRNGDPESNEYYNAFTNFIKSTTKIDLKDINNTDIVLNGKKYKRKLLNL